MRVISSTSENASDIKQLLDEVEHDIMNYQNRGLCNQADVELDMINAISAADITFVEYI